MKEIAEWMQKRLARDCPPLDGVETDINKRWETGMEHHPESEKLMAAIETLDFIFMNDYFCWKTGGDGDNGEQLMYLMDIYFEARDKNGQSEVKRLKEKVQRLQWQIEDLCEGVTHHPTAEEIEYQLVHPDGGGENEEAEGYLNKGDLTEI